MEQREAAGPEREGQDAAGGRRALRRPSPPTRRRGRGEEGRGRPVLSPRTRGPPPGLARREASARRRQQWGARRPRGRSRRRLHGGGRSRSGPRGGRRTRGLRNDTVERAARRRRAGVGGWPAGGTGALSAAAPACGPRRAWVSASATAPPASAASAQALTYLVELFAHIRVNVYVVHAVRHLPSASAAAAAASSCRFARRGSSGGSSGGGGASCVTSAAPGARRGRPGRRSLAAPRRGGLGSGAGSLRAEAVPYLCLLRPGLGCPICCKTIFALPLLHSDVCSICISQFFLYFSQPGS